MSARSTSPSASARWSSVSASPRSCLSRSEAPRQARDLFGEDAVHRADHPGLPRRQTTQLPWQRQPPLSYGYAGQDAIDELHRLATTSGACRM